MTNMESTAAYYNSVRYLDENVGRVIAALKRYGRYENTLIVYMADHGYCLGHHGRFEKHCGYEPALRVPLIFWWPGHARQSVVTDLTESVDVPHTILDSTRCARIAGSARAFVAAISRGKNAGDSPGPRFFGIPRE